MTNSIELPKTPAHLMTKKMARTKVKVSGEMLPMLVTILPARIVGSEQCDGNVILVVEGYGLPKTEFSTIFVNRESDAKSTIEIRAVNG